VKIYYVTTNEFKITEARDYVASHHIEDRLDLSFLRSDVQEILHPDVSLIVRQKTIEAFKQIRWPCVVEHGGLFMDALPGLPGGVGKIVWDAVGERICGFLSADDPRGATARSFLGYCDGRRVRVYVGETRGRIADRARGAYSFAWDPIFIPEGSEKTYGEMGLEGKRTTSPIVKAWEAFMRAEVPKAGPAERR
jgi:XTP/dITP diphosphohydrolase